MIEQPNLDYINQLAGDNQEFKTKVITIIKTELPQEIALYQHLMTQGNYILAAQSVHKLKHKISLLGLEKSYYTAQEFEQNLNQNSTKLHLDFQNILLLIQNFVNTL